MSQLETRRWLRVVLVSSRIILVLITGGSGIAAENTEMPDHSALVDCAYCHIDKADDWKNSNHPRNIRNVRVYNANGTSCEDCHSHLLIEKAEKNQKHLEEPAIAHHMNACLSCHVPGSHQYEKQLVATVDEVCETCHFQREMFWGNTFKGLDNVRNFHSGVSCVNCHMNNGNHQMKVVRPDDPNLGEDQLDTCTNCHQDDNRAARIEQIQEWQEAYHQDIAPLIEKISKIDSILKSKPDILTPALKAAYQDARYNVLLMKKDGSRGFHNFILVLAVRATAGGVLEEVDEIIK